MLASRKVFLSLALAGAIASVGAFATFSAFSSTTTNSGNSFDAGTVYLSDNDAGSALYNLTGQVPGVPASGCIKLTYTGSLPATVKLYTTSSVGLLAQYLDMAVEKGTLSGSPAFPSCTGFTPDPGGTVYGGTLANFALTQTSFATGVSAFPGSQTQWNQNDSLVYRVTLTLQNNAAANGGASPLSTGTHAFTWEAQNQ